MKRMVLIFLLVSSLLNSVWAQTPPSGVAARRTPVVTVAEKVSPAVVNISAESTVREVDPFFGLFFGPTTRSAQSLGSGLIIDPNGIEVVRGIDRGGLLLAVGRGRYVYNLDFPL